MGKLPLVVVMAGMMALAGCGGQGPAKGDGKEDPRKVVGTDPEPVQPKAAEPMLKDAQWCAAMLQQLSIAQANAGGAASLTFGPAKAYSWRVGLLPHMEQEPAFKELQSATGDFNAPVPKDAKVAELGVFLLPSLKGKGAKTVFRRVLLPGARADAFVVAESSELVDWAAPGDELVVQEGKPLPRLGGNFKGGFFALCADEKVRFVPATLDAAAVRKALVDGEGVPALPTAVEDQEKEIKKLLGG